LEFWRSVDLFTVGIKLFKRNDSRFPQVKSALKIKGNQWNDLLSPQKSTLGAFIRAPFQLI
jgi:hypothetical protein